MSHTPKKSSKSTLGSSLSSTLSAGLKAVSGLQGKTLTSQQKSLLGEASNTLSNIKSGLSSLSSQEKKRGGTGSDFLSKPFDVSLMTANEQPAQLPPPPITEKYNPLNLTATPQLNEMGFNVTDNQFQYNQPALKDDTTDLANQRINKSNLDYIKGLLGNETPDNAKILAKEEKAAGIREKQQEFSNYTNQLNTIVKQGQADVLSAQNQSSTEGGTAGILSARTDAINRSTTIKALPVQAQLEAAQGNLEMAQAHVDKMFEIKSLDAANKYNRFNKILEVTYDIATKSEQRRLDELHTIAKRSQDIEDRNIAEVRSWTQYAITSGQPNLINAFSQINPSSPTFDRDLSLVQSRMTGGIDLQIKQAQLSKLNQEVNANIEASKPITFSVDPTKTVAENNLQTLQSVFQSNKVSAGNKTSIGNGLALAKAAQDLATANLDGKFTGFGPTRSLVDYKTPSWIPFLGNKGIPLREAGKRSKTIENESLISALDLQTQFWASGAALSPEQTKLVQKMIPVTTDTDRQIKVKTNQLINYMLSQTSSRLITDGIDYRPAKVDMFETVDLLEKVSPQQLAELQALGLIK